jgi:pSer/pThr/pTyr-binding forkhead associated (FHA) protein
VAELHLLVDSVVVKSFTLDKERTTIGRSQDNDIVIDEDAVSGEHARVDLVPNEYMEGVFDIFIEDLDSTNGTFVNEERVKRQQLYSADQIRIAWTNFKLVYDKAPDLEATSIIAR